MPPAAASARLRLRSPASGGSPRLRKARRKHRDWFFVSRQGKRSACGRPLLPAGSNEQTDPPLDRSNHASVMLCLRLLTGSSYALVGYHADCSRRNSTLRRALDSCSRLVLGWRKTASAEHSDRHPDPTSSLTKPRTSTIVQAGCAFLIINMAGNLTTASPAVLTTSKKSNEAG